MQKGLEDWGKGETERVGAQNLSWKRQNEMILSQNVDGESEIQGSRSKENGIINRNREE